MTRWASVLFIASAITAVGCQGRRADEPPPIRYGEQTCVECRMLINEARFAAAADTTSETVAFDAIECLVRWLARGTSTQRIWVHDYHSSAWLDGRTAWFVHSRALVTPMGAGLVALATEPAARALTNTVRGEIMRFEQLAHVHHSGGP